MKRDGKLASLEAELNSPTKLLERILSGKDEKIASLQSELKNYKPHIDSVDLITEKAERASKHPCQANLDDARDDLGDDNDLVQQQYLAQDIWQIRFYELAMLAEVGQVDAAAISDIRKGSLASDS